MAVEQDGMRFWQKAVYFLEVFEDFVLNIGEELRTATAYEREILMYEMRHDLAYFRDLGKDALWPAMDAKAAADLRARYDRVARSIASYGGWVERFARGEAQEPPPEKNEGSGVQ